MSVVIVTGSNTGLGLEATRHFVRLNASKVILACRNVDKGEAAKKDIEESTRRHDVAQVWQLDLCSYESVKSFVQQADNTLERLDILVNNAGMTFDAWDLAENHEMTLTVNVISPLLLSISLLPLLRASGRKFNMTPRVVFVSSEGAFMTKFPERTAENIFKTLDTNHNLFERYNTAKLLQLIIIQKLAKAYDSSAKGHVLINALAPGLCNTAFYKRSSSTMANFLLRVLFWPFWRDAEMGSRTIMAAAFADEDTHGKWMSHCKLQRWPGLMVGEDGEDMADRVWAELVVIMEGIQGGVTRNI
ncbi:hypothetical protein BHE90_011445 [Fusarium euwallaceae]|uniref:Ketoreductase (KR) domain-containing protein n=1 Tax=Fusarium euwallaceae TaxID=1147111 RepID=A0A430LEH7_9HYPO|nr:hypothetical protein BHE90_011445 [Fusarium euwallaceae]